MDNGPGLWAGNGYGKRLDCRSRLYQFTLSDTGQPSALTPFSAMPELAGDLFYMAISANGNQVAFTMIPCEGGGKRLPSYLMTISAVTGQTRRWTNTEIDLLALSSNGRLLLYNASAAGSGEGRAELRVIPTNAPSGSLAGHSRTVISAKALGRSGSFSFGGLSPDGSTVYFGLVAGRREPGVIGSVGLAGGRPRTIAMNEAPRITPGRITPPDVMLPDPQLRNLILSTGPGSQMALLDLRTGRSTPVVGGLQRFVVSYGSFTTW